MTDDKITRLPTGYEPDTPPPSASDIQELHWAIAMLADEITDLSRAVRTLIRQLRKE